MPCDESEAWHVVKPLVNTHATTTHKPEVHCNSRQLFITKIMRLVPNLVQPSRKSAGVEQASQAGTGETETVQVHGAANRGIIRRIMCGE